MSETNSLCILAINTRADENFLSRLGQTEAEHAAERCLNRAERVIAGHSGVLLIEDERSLVAGFEHCDSAVLAAGEILERVRSLPTISGLRQPVRIAVHGGEQSMGTGRAATIDLARQLAEAAGTEQALASAAVVAALSPASRHLVARKTLKPALTAHFPFPLFAIGERSQRSSISLPPASNLPRRLHLRHQHKSFFVDELRPVLLLGRELGNDIVIGDARASRQHARIERRREGFFLIDASTNGCYVAFDTEHGRTEQHLRQEQLLLNVRGCFGCGFAADGRNIDEIFFELV